MPEQYVWFVWAAAFLLPWIALYLALPGYRRAIVWASLYTMPFGLSEPFFVPEYWNPPSLFDLARRTGFDIESFVFTFATGGVAAVVYPALTRSRLRPVTVAERRHPRHRHHALALAAPVVAFPILYLLPWNPIYAALLALVIGATAALACRPDLARKTWVGGALFLGYYVVFLLGLEWLAPGYVARVWNLAALSGIVPLGMPLEELLYAVAFGMYWSGVYEHFTWRRVT